MASSTQTTERHHFYMTIVLNGIKCADNFLPYLVRGKESINQNSYHDYHHHDYSFNWPFQTQIVPSLTGLPNRSKRGKVRIG